MKYRKKSVVVEAFEYDRDLIRGTNEYVGDSSVPDWIRKAHDEGILLYAGFIETKEGFIDRELFIETLEGRMHVSLGDYIIKGIQGELYPCKPDIFAKTYEKI